MDRDEFAEVTKHIAQLTSWVDSVKVRVTRRQRQLADQGRAEPPADLLRVRAASPGDARTADDREQVCSILPNFEEALAAGAVSAGHVDGSRPRCGAWIRSPPPSSSPTPTDLLTRANNQSVDTFGHSCRDLARLIAAEQAAGSELSELERQKAAAKVTRWVDKPSGMHKTCSNWIPNATRPCGPRCPPR